MGDSVPNQERSKTVMGKVETRNARFQTRETSSALLQTGSQDRVGGDHGLSIEPAIQHIVVCTIESTHRTRRSHKQLSAHGCGVYWPLPSPMRRRRNASLAASQTTAPTFAWSSR